jgi:hypothetical protein
MMPDWVLCVDEGVGAMTAGQFLKELLPFYPGSNQDERCANLWQHIQNLYQEKGWPASRRLKRLTVKNIVKPKKPAELDCNIAATCTALRLTIYKSLRKLEENSSASIWL